MPILISIISAAGFYLVPTFVGRAFVGLTYKKPLSYPYITYFLGGSLVLYAAMILVGIISWLIPSLSYDGMIFVVLGVSLVAAFIGNIFVPFRDSTSILHLLAPFSFSVLLAVVVYGIWQIDSMYPFNWDLLHHQTLARYIRDTTFHILPSRVTDTFGFNGYSTIFHTLLALAQKPFSFSYFAFWHVISVIHLTFVIFASYLLAKEVTHNTTIAALSAILSGFLFESTIAFTSLFLIPQTFTAVVFMYVFTQLIAEIKKKRLPDVYPVALSGIFIFLNHYIVGFAALCIYAGTYLYMKYHRVIVQKVNRLAVIEAGLVVAFVVIIISPSLSLGFINQGEAEEFSLGLFDKF
jgi:hypothetical protein